MIMVQSFFHLNPETKSDVIVLMNTMVEKSRQEPGCISYEYFEGITDSDQVVLLQEWESADHLQSHYQTQHMEEFLRKLGHYLKSPISTRSYASEDELLDSNDALDEEAIPSEQTIH